MEFYFKYFVFNKDWLERLCTSSFTWLLMILPPSKQSLQLNNQFEETYQNFKKLNFKNSDLNRIF